jgi:hypothetical protein
MAGFCKNCGSPVSGAFCGKCGTRVDAPSTPAQQVQPSQPAPQTPSAVASQAAAPVAKKSNVGKVLLIVGGIFMAICVFAIGGTIYGVHLLKKKVKEKAGMYTGGAVGGSESVAVTQGNTCALLSKEELGQVLGVPVERSQEIQEGEKPGCAYYTNPEAFGKLQQMAIEQAKKDSAEAAKQPGPKGDNPLVLLKDANKLEGVVKTFGLSQPDKEGRVFGFTIDREFGRGNWDTVRTTMSAIPGFEDVDGTGDRAMMGPFGHVFVVLKGDSLISLETISVPDVRAKGAEIGRRIASRM